MHVFRYVLNGSDTNCNCSGGSGGGNFDNKGSQNTISGHSWNEHNL